MSHLPKDDLTCNADSRLQHALHFIEGYRAWMRGKGVSECPYSPGSAREHSWTLGWDTAMTDDGNQAIEWMSQELMKIEADDRFQAPMANVQVNASLALVQVAMKARRGVILHVLRLMGRLP